MYRNEVVAVFGHRGSGKSTWLARTMEDCKPYLLVDPLYDPKYLKSDIHQLSSLEEALRMFRDGDPQRLYATPNLITFDYLCGLCLARGSMTLIVDEVDNYATSQYLTDNFRKIIKRGRHREVNLVSATRRPMEMNKLIRSQANRFIVFPMGMEDAKDLESYVGPVWKKVMDLTMDDVGVYYLDYDFKAKDWHIKRLDYFIIDKNVEICDTILTDEP